ncbi:MAG: hypothetical protein ACRC62_24045 [Microcoleus sp.]
MPPVKPTIRTIRSFIIRRKKEEGRRKREEGRRSYLLPVACCLEGRRKKTGGIRKNAWWVSF